VLAAGAFAGLALSAHYLAQSVNACRVAGYGALIGIGGFLAVIFAAPFASLAVFAVGVALVGLGGGLFAMGTLTATMEIDAGGFGGMTIGAWGAVQATAAGLGIALGGGLRDFFGNLAASGALGTAMDGPATGYQVVYHLEIGLLFATLIAIGPLATRLAGGVQAQVNARSQKQLGLAAEPGWSTLS
jgi:BCD family chlorophyll transporter-like MFS transporter